MSFSVEDGWQLGVGSDPPLVTMTTELGVDVQNTVESFFQRSLAKPFVCRKCGKEFSQKQTLQYHDISQHTGSYRFTCHQCGKGFYQRYRFQGHLRMHANIRSYICPDCGKGFFSGDAKRDHMKKCSALLSSTIWIIVDFLESVTCTLLHSYDPIPYHVTNFAWKWGGVGLGLGLVYYTNKQINSTNEIS